MRIRSLPAAALALLLLGGSARADYQFVFTDSSGTASSSFTVAQGATVDIRVYLAQTPGSTGLSDTGLNSGGVKLTYDSSVAKVANTSAITPNAKFDGNSTSVATNAASVGVFMDSSSANVMAPTSGADANRILLGTFTFTGVSAGSTLTLTADPHTVGADNVLANGTVLDPSILNSSAAISVTAVPEPGSLALCGLALSGACAAYLRRRFARKDSPAPAAAPAAAQ